STMVALMLLTVTVQAWAFGMGGRAGFGGPAGHGGGHGMPLRLLVRQLSPDQRQQVRQILAAERGDVRDTLKQLHAAHDALADTMLGPGTVTAADVASQEQTIATLHQQLLDHGTKVMLQVRAIATPDQLAKAAASKKQLDQLRAQIQTILGAP